MKPKILILVLICVLLGCTNEKQKVIDTYNKFNLANIERDGERLFELSDSNTHNYYKNFLTKILKLDSVGVSKLNLTEKLNLLSARAVIHDSILKRISPKDLLIKMLTEVSSMDSTQISSIRSLGITNIKIENNIANCELTMDGKVVSPLVNLEFSKENGKWKFDLNSLAEFTEEQLNYICEYHGFTHLDFIEWVFDASNIGEKR
uniref:hypothetical protein n=1 Tax=uncultured Lacinutrix sp. TaxID=574032 RepID=UPI00260B67A5